LPHSEVSRKKMKKQPEHTLLLALKKSSGEAGLLEALHNNDFNLLVSHTGEETIRIYNGHPKIDLIIITTDITGKDAFETVDEIRKNNTSVPVILLSDFVTINILRLALGIGCSEILQTPLGPGTLEGILEKYLFTN